MMSELRVYRMSEAGGCIRALAASRLGYDPISRRDNTVLFREGKRHESHIAEDLAEMGYVLEDAGECYQCKEEFGETGISGHHVEISTPLIRLIGHIDRILLIDDHKYPCEFKSMGLFMFQKFKKEGLSVGYQAQVACYTGKLEKPGLYVVKCRDSGEMALYTVPYRELVIPGHTVLLVHTTLEQVIERLHLAEVFVRTGELPECEYPESGRRWCDFRYLCLDPKEESETPEVNQEELLEAASLHKEGKEMEKGAVERIEYARQIFLQHAKQVPKFRAGGVSVTYRGRKQKEYLDSKGLKEAHPNIHAKFTKKSAPYDDMTIRVVENT